MKTLNMLRALVALGLMAMTAAGCGDGPICPETAVISVSAPNGVVSADNNLDIPGTQVDVVVATNAVSGVPLLLEVRNAAGDILVPDPQGEPGAKVMITSDGSGTATFKDITVPTGALTFTVTAEAGACGTDTKSTVIQIAVGADCTLALNPLPQANAFYAPREVYILADDADDAIADLQVAATVTGLPGFTVQVIATDSEGSEEVVHTIDAIGQEAVQAAITLRDGERTVFARCIPPIEDPGTPAVRDLETTVSESYSLYVDTVVPSCEFTTPIAGSSITQAADKDASIGNGLQFDLVLGVSDEDVEGETASISVTPPSGGTTATNVLVAEGVATLEATFTDTGISPWQIAATATDHAGNVCQATSDLRVVYGGCAISATSAPTNVDAAPGTSGVQVNANVVVDAACVGRAITSDCGSNDPGGLATGNDTFAVTVCAGATCETQQTCTFRITTAGGVETTASVQLAFDNIAPPVGLQLIAPPVSCGTTITSAEDANPGLAGVQAVVRILAPLTADRELTHTLPDTSVNIIDGNVPGGEITVTLQPGLNAFRGSASDTFGNANLSAICTLTLADLAVSFSPPIADGHAGGADGTVSGNDLIIDLCGTVSEVGTAVTVAIDGGAPQTATVTGAAWCLSDAALGEGVHTIVAEATIGPRVGEASLQLSIDIAPPPPPTGLVATPLTRQSLQLQWNAPVDVSDAVGYLIKVSPAPITEGNFDALPVLQSLSGAGTGGELRSELLSSLRPGATVYVAIVTIDAAGNRSSVASVLTSLAFTKVGPVVLAAPVGDASLGLSMTAGRFNNDAFDDIAVGAPFEDNGLGRVYVYFGSASGTAVTPGATLRGTEGGAQFGNSVAAVRWSSATMDDLAIGAPLSGGLEGAIYIFKAGVTGLAGTLDDTADSLTLRATGGWFASSGLGYSMTTARFDGDAVDDLVIGAVAANGFTGGVAVVYGATIGTSVTAVDLHDADASGLGGAAISLINSPTNTGTDFFSFYLYNVGRTQGATDVTDDLLIGYTDDTASVSTTNNRAMLMRGTPGRPANSTVEVRAFDVTRDVILDLDSSDVTTDFAAAATSIQDQNSDGARDLVISAFREGTGVVYIVDGNVLGNGQGVALLTNPAVRLSRIVGAGGHTMFGAAIANNTMGSLADVDNDGIEDLVVAASTSPGAVYLVWYGGSIPVGNAVSTSANYSVVADASISLTYPNNGGVPGVLLWCDVNGDGLDDLALSSSYDNARDGVFEVLTR